MVKTRKVAKKQLSMGGASIKKRSVAKKTSSTPKNKGWTELDRSQKIGVILLIVVLSGFVGWVWEFFLAEIEGGFHHLYIEGGNLLPWVNIYAYGALLIMLTTFKFRKHPLLVFMISAIVCGTLELFAGWVVFMVGHGTRYWNYTHAWFGLGNINGFVCPVSALTFGLGALVLMYCLLPWCINLATKMTKRAFLTLSITLFTVVILDDLTNLTLKNLDLPTAHRIYRALGWVYKK